MALETTNNRQEYAGNGVTTNFSFPYYFLAEADLVVILRDDTTLVETVKTLTTHYTVTGEGDEAGGTVTMLVAPTSDETLIIYRDAEIIQDKDFRENDSLPAEQVEEAYDRLTMVAQRLDERADRTVRVSEGFSLGSFDLTLPPDLLDSGNEGKTIVLNEDLDGFTMGPSMTEVEASAAAAAASASAASSSASAAASSASSASTSASTATTQAAAASASAAAAATAAASNIWRDVVFLTFADSPRTILASERGKLFACDTSGGAIAITLPQISGLDLSTPFTIGFKKTSSDGNSITLTRAGTDTIDGSTTKTMSVANGGSTLIPDTDPSPDTWTSADFGASAGNLIQDKFSGNASQTAFTLSTSPGSENNTFVFVSGVYQSKETYSVSGTTLTFSSAPPTGTDNIEVMIGTLLSIGVPSDGTVGPEKLTSAAVDNMLLSNVGLATSVGSSALTIALKQADGSTNPTTGSGQVKVAMRSSTLTSGAINIRSVTSALSLVVSSGSTLGQASALAARLYIYLIDNAGTLELAISQKLHDETQLISTTAEGGAGGADSGTVMYSTTARSNVPFRVIGFLDNTQTTAGTWASAGTKLQVGDRSVVDADKVTFVANGSSSSSVGSNTTIPFNTPSEDTVSGWNSTNKDYEVKISGTYKVGAQSRVTGTATVNQYVNTLIQIDAATVREGLKYVENTGVGGWTGPVSWQGYLNAGQKIRGVCDTTIGSPSLTTSGTHTFLEIARIK